MNTDTPLMTLRVAVAEPAAKGIQRFELLGAWRTDFTKIAKTFAEAIR